MALFPGGTGEQSSASEGAQGHSPARRAGRALDKGGIWPTHWAGVVTVQCLSEEEMSEPLIHDHQPASMLQGSFSAVSEYLLVRSGSAPPGRQRPINVVRSPVFRHLSLDRRLSAISNATTHTLPTLCDR